MLHLALDRVDARDVELSPRAPSRDQACGLLRDEAHLRHRIGRMRLDLETRCGTRVSGDQIAVISGRA